MKNFLLAVATVLLAGIVFALVWAWSGVYNVAATEPHWPYIKWYLEMTLDQSVDTHSMGITAPDLDRPALVYAGLAHYETGCALCHGRPGETHRPIAGAMRPEAPYLPAVIADWEPRELFWIVKNGFKYTAMPAWPAESRDDEVWAMVAALLRLPDMTEAEYKRITRGDTRFDPARIEETGRLLAAAGPVGENLGACGRCHGMLGAGGGAGAFPRLAGLSETYILEAMQAYATGARPSGIMGPIASELDPGEIATLAAYYAALDTPPLPLDPPPSPELIERGRLIAEGRGKAPACAACHGPGRLPRYPALAGQYPHYIAQQLRLFVEGKRGDTPLSSIMAVATEPHDLDDVAIAAVAAYYGSLPPEGR